MNGSRTNISLKIWSPQEPKCDSLWLLLGWQPLPISEKPLFHVASLREGLNWLPQEVRMSRGGGFRPACRYVFYCCPGMGIILTIPLVCVCVCAVVTFLWLVCWGKSCSLLSKSCRIYSHPWKPSPFFHPSVPLPPNSVLYSLDTTHFAAVPDCLGNQLAQLWSLVPEVSVFCLGRRKFVLLFHTRPLWDVLTMMPGKSLDGYQGNFLP